jgi:hypothetical protein
MPITILVEKRKGRHHLEDLGVDGKIILEGTLGTGCIWLRIRTSDGLL